MFFPQQNNAQNLALSKTKIKAFGGFGNGKRTHLVGVLHRPVSEHLGCFRMYCASLKEKKLCHSQGIRVGIYPQKVGRSVLVVDNWL